MGLFTNKKKLCPICGNPTPRLLPQKFDDQPICKECEKNIDLPDDVLNNMTLDGFRQYLVDYNSNQSLRTQFAQTFRYDFDFTPVILDEEHGLIRLSNKERSWAIEKKNLKSFRIFEDDNILLESADGTLNSYPSGIPARAEALVPIVSAFHMEKRAYERNEHMERIHSRGETDEQRRERERIANTYRPRFEAPELFRGFRIEMVFDHPYWRSFEGTERGPVFDADFPSVDSYMKHYREQTEQLHLLAVKLMHLIDPEAGETQIGEAAVSVASSISTVPVDAVAEIKKYKELLEQGVITEEEFAAKKKKLLGI